MVQSYKDKAAVRIGGKLRSLRKERGLTGEEVAKQLGLSRTALTNYETGRRIPKDSYKKIIAKYYDKTVEELFYSPYLLCSPPDFKPEVKYVWIPVSEEMPNIHETVLIYGKSRYRFQKVFCKFVDVGCLEEPEADRDIEKWSTYNDWYEGQEDFTITHWMPLPEPPKEDEA